MNVSNSKFLQTEIRKTEQVPNWLKEENSLKNWPFLKIVVW